MSKAEITARYKTLKGYNALFPFGFHCTGMPISAAAKKLKEELEIKGIEKLQEIASERQEAKKAKTPFDAPMTQYEILKFCEVEDIEISKFIEPEFWLKYFPGRAQTDLENFGMSCDFRRSFITTSLNPYYNSFIEW